MDQHERQHKQSQQFDIFDSSPQRPFANAHLNDSLDQLVLPNGDINFSRKREQSPRQGEDEHEHGPKRHRSENWPLQENASGGNESRQKPSTCHHLTSPSKRRGTPVRPSKFVEASMHDRPSGTPPSMFVRNLNVHITNASVDHLMEDYDQLQSKPLPPRPSSRASRSRSPIKRRQQSSEFTHHANQSISSNGLLSAPSTIADEQKQSGGFFRFGKSMASAFNPVNVWQKVSNNWRETKEELIQEAIVKKELDERKIKAAETYNTLKKSGKLEKQGSRPLSEIFTPGYTKPSEEPNQRDSGIALDFDDRSSVDTGGRPRSMAPPGGESLRKSPFHFRTPSMNNFKDPAAVDDDETPRKSFRHLRTPSLHDLKRIASEVSLHKRSVSTSISRSPEKEGTPGMNDLRRSISKKDLLKQDKLSRRVSDLEAKLEAARCELQSALKDPPATETADDTPRASRSRSGPRPRTSMGTWKRAFTPGLPTLLSERLLGGESAEERERESMEENEMFTSAINETQERPKTRNFSGDSLYTLPNEPLATNLGFIPLNVSLLDSIEIKEKGAEVGDTAHPSTQVPEVIELPHKLPELPFIATQTEPAALARSLTRKPVAKKKRASLEDRVYRPSKNEPVESDSDWDPNFNSKMPRKRAAAVKPKNSPKAKEASESKPIKDTATSDPDWQHKPKTLKKQVNASSPKASPNAKKTARNSTASAASNIPVMKTNVLKKPQPVSKLPPMETEEGLETVHEEISTTATVPLNGDPSKPTAHATPAHPTRNFVRSRSRSRSRSPEKRSRVSATSNGSYTNRDARSMSPTPSSARGKGRSSPDNPVSVRPGDGNGAVPPLPVFNSSPAKDEGRKGEEFEWPDDVF